MTQLYEAMVLISNQVVREDWRKAKGLVGDLLTKHNANVKSLRRFEERRLAYPIQGNLRATYYLAYFEIPGDDMPSLRRDFELTEQVLRNLVMAVDALPEGELEKAAEEEGTDYTVPEPPADDEPEEEVEQVELDEDGNPIVVEKTEEAEGSEGGKADDADAKKETETAEVAAATEPEAAQPNTEA